MSYKYNIFVNNFEKLNKVPMSKDDVDLIMKRKFIYKVINGINTKIDVSKLSVKKCIVI